MILIKLLQESLKWLVRKYPDMLVSNFSRLFNGTVSVLVGPRRNALTRGVKT